MSFPKTGALITMLGLSDSQRLGFLEWLGSRVLGSAKQFGPRLLSTVTWGMIHNYLPSSYDSERIQKNNEKLVDNPDFQCLPLYSLLLAAGNPTVNYLR